MKIPLASCRMTAPNDCLAHCPFLGAMLVRGLNAFVELALRMAPATKLPKAVKQGYRYPYQNWKDRIATHRFVQDIPLNTSHPTWQTLAEIEKKLPLLEDRKILLLANRILFHMRFQRWKKRILPKCRNCPASGGITLPARRQT